MGAHRRTSFRPTWRLVVSAALGLLAAAVVTAVTAYATPVHKGHNEGVFSYHPLGATKPDHGQ